MGKKRKDVPDAAVMAPEPPRKRTNIEAVDHSDLLKTYDLEHHTMRHGGKKDVSDESRALTEQMKEKQDERVAEQQKKMLEEQIKNMAASQLQGRHKREWYKQRMEGEMRGKALGNKKVPFKMLQGIKKKDKKDQGKKRQVEQAFGLVVHGSSAKVNRQNGKERERAPQFHIPVGRQLKNGMLSISKNLQKQVTRREM